MKNPKPRDAKTHPHKKRLGGALAVLALAITGMSFHTLIQSAHAQTAAHCAHGRAARHAGRRGC